MSEAPIRIGHPEVRREGDLCGCCEGTMLSTVQPIWNRPNLTVIAYRVGDHPRFKASMLTSLASAEFGAPSDLRTRADDDFTIALIDAWATACEVLSFYQERHANEAYIQTARERLSIGEVARLIGYRLHPGSAAETDPVFLMDDPPGAEPDVADLDIEMGTRVQSQPGPGEETPLFGSVSGSEIELDLRVEGLEEGRRLMVTGRRAQVSVVVRSLAIKAESGQTRTAPRDTRLTLQAAPQPITGKPDTFLWRLTDAGGFEGSVEAREDAFLPIRADETAGVVAEAAVLDRVDDVDPAHSKLVLKNALTQAYDRADLAIHANVARASHGEGAIEILGSGDPSHPHQSFQLKQNPVTQLVASSENGIASTLKVRVDGVEWDEVPDLYKRDPKARTFATSHTDSGETVIRFGDGVSGARPPAGRDNIVADYRKGLGRAGNVRAGQLTLPLDRPLGLRDVKNDLPATGGANPEEAGEARRNAPIYTLTLGRVVSITDYRDFALGYPGIAKADARWVWDGETRRIVVTIAGDGGAVIPKDGPICPALLAAYRDRGDPFVQFDLISYIPSHFRLGLKVGIDRAYQAPAVLDAIETALRAAFAFDARDFADPVALSRIAAVAHDVAGVVAVDVDRLYRDIAPQTSPIAHDLLVARSGQLGSGGALMPAEVLTLSPEPFDALEMMS